MARDITAGIEQAFSERSDLLVVALTGRTGSGCTTTAEIMCKPYSDLAISIGDFTEPEARKIAIAKNFLGQQWVPFKQLTVSTVILSFLIEQEIDAIKAFFEKNKVPVKDTDELLQLFEKLRLKTHYTDFLSCAADGDKVHSAEAWNFYYDELRPAAIDVRRILKALYAPIFQSIGDNIRFSGSALSSEVNPKKIFTLLRRVKRLVKAAFSADTQLGRKSTRVVIDAIRNPLELLYLRDQFAAFYAIAITTDDEHRTARLENIGYVKSDIYHIDEKEYSTTKKSLSSYDTFVSQNIQECIQKSDIFFANPGLPAEYAQNIRKINAQVVRYVALMLRPGLVTPTRDERCMQLAFVAKVNSGCISRQVGAAVADQNYSIKSVGWNDVPKGQTPCLLRDVSDLLTGGDEFAFSYFERTDPKLRKHIGEKFKNRNAIRSTTGMPCPYCFKDAYNDISKDKNQVHTRSLHAEENAFLQLAKYGSSGIDKGILYTTASPCELCSKKAYQLGIKEVVYVDPYPGISASHVLNIGDKINQPELRLFGGAVGHAYHRLYETILPIKDEYYARLKDDPSGPQQRLL